MDRTRIEWCEGPDGPGATWNPIMGCTPISEGCEHCYARRMIVRYAGRKGWPGSPDAVTLFPERLGQPRRWRRPRRIFVCSMGDLFHEAVPADFILETWRAMAACPRHTFLVLTKRPRRLSEWIEDYAGFAEDNIWLGVTCETEQRAQERIPWLLQAEARVRFLSLEPMLGPIDLGEFLRFRVPGGTVRSIDWVIVGGETGSGARPMHPDWVRGIRDQCEAAGVAFFFKGWGAWRPIGRQQCIHPWWHRWPDGVTMDRAGRGRDAAGHLLDGVEHRKGPAIGARLSGGEG